MTAAGYRLLVFDWDGTLSDSAGLIVHAMQQACVDVGQPMPSEEAARAVIGLGVVDALRRFVPALDPADYPRFGERYRHHFLPRDEEIALFPGIADLLSELEARGCLLAIATGKSRGGLERALRQSGLGDRFAASRCADEGPPKPHPDMLLQLMRRLGATPAETVMIGDTTHDLELARNAGVDAVAVSYGAHDRDTLTQWNPVAAVHSVAELRAWLLGLPPACR
jgi:phosphoglycolate phosphatase